MHPVLRSPSNIPKIVGFQPSSVKSLLAHRSKLTLTLPLVRFLAIEANSNDKSNDLGDKADSATSLYPLGQVLVYPVPTLKQEKKEKTRCTPHVQKSVSARKLSLMFFQEDSSQIIHSFLHTP